MSERALEKLQESGAKVDIFAQGIVCPQTNHGFRLESEKGIVFKGYIDGDPGLQQGIIEDTHLADIVIHLIIHAFDEALATSSHAHGTGRDIECPQGNFRRYARFIFPTDDETVLFG